MIKNILILFIILLFTVPFTYILIMDIIDITNRFLEIFNKKIKPAVVLVTKSFINM